MSGVEGSSLQQHQLRIQQTPVQRRAPQILRPIPNRHFSFSPTRPRPVAIDPRLFPNLCSSLPAGADKDKIPTPDDPLKQTIRAADYGVENGKAAVKQEVKEEIVPLETGKNYKRPKKPKLPKHKKFSLQTLGSTDDILPNTLVPSINCRYDSSLGLLTKKFINLLQQAEDGTLDLNRAADILDVQKRRIYDITNVLEGVNLIEKNLKNRIHWKGIDMSRPKELNDQIAKLKAEMESLSKEDCRLDGMIREMQENLNALSEDKNNQKWLYVTQKDINSIPFFEDDTLIAIKAPRGTSVEVPDPDEGADFPRRRYQILLRSSMGPIDCFILSNYEEKSEASNQDPQPSTIHCSFENSCNYMDNDSSWQPADQDTVGTSGQGQEQSRHKISSDSISVREYDGGIVKIVPSDADVDADYWLLSDLRVSITDTWEG